MGRFKLAKNTIFIIYNDFDQIEHVRQAIAKSRLRFNGAVHVQLDQCVYLFKQFSEYELLRIMSAYGSHFSSVHVDDGIRGYIVSQYCGYLSSRPPTCKNEVVIETIFYERA